MKALSSLNIVAATITALLLLSGPIYGLQTEQPETKRIFRTRNEPQKCQYQYLRKVIPRRRRKQFWATRRFAQCISVFYRFEQALFEHRQGKELRPNVTASRSGPAQVGPLEVDPDVDQAQRDAQVEQAQTGAAYGIGPAIALAVPQQRPRAAVFTPHDDG